MHVFEHGRVLSGEVALSNVHHSRSTVATVLERNREEPGYLVRTWANSGERPRG